MSEVVKCFVCQSKSQFQSADGTNVNGQKKRRKTNNENNNYHNLDDCTWRIFCTYFYPPPLIGLCDQQQSINPSDNLTTSATKNVLNTQLVKTAVFCSNCYQTISQLSGLHEQLELIRGQINKIVAQVSLTFVQTEDQNDDYYKDDDGIPPFKRKRTDEAFAQQDDDDVIYSMRKCIRQRYQPLVLVDKTNVNLSNSKIEVAYQNSNENTAEIDACFSLASIPLYDFNLDLSLSIPIKQEIQDIDLSTFDNNNDDDYDDNDPLEIENDDSSIVNELETTNVKTIREKKTKKKAQKNKATTKKVKSKSIIIEAAERKEDDANGEEEEKEDKKWNKSENLASENDSDYESKVEKPEAIKKSKTSDQKKRKVRNSTSKEKRRRGRPRKKPTKEPTIRKFQKDEEIGENTFLYHGQWMYEKKENAEGNVRYYCLTCFHKPEVVDRDTLAKHINNKHDIERPACDNCTKRFSCEEKLAQHKSRATCIATYQKHRTKRVDADNFIYDEVYHIQRVREPHGIFFKCLTCGALRKSIAMLKTHLRETHIDPGKYVCEQCGRAFPSKEKLRRHFESHSDAKNFICESCGGFFKTQRELASHREKHRSEPFKCECGRTFVYKKGLRTHRRDANHPAPEITSTPPEFFTPQKCEMCTREFYSDKNFKLHTSICRGKVKQYCDLCGGHYYRVETHQRLYCKRTLLNQNGNSSNINNSNNNQSNIQDDSKNDTNEEEQHNIETIETVQ